MIELLLRIKHLFVNKQIFGKEKKTKPDDSIEFRFGLYNPSGYLPFWGYDMQLQLEHLVLWILMLDIITDMTLPKVGTHQSKSDHTISCSTLQQQSDPTMTMPIATRRQQHSRTRTDNGNCKTGLQLSKQQRPPFINMDVWANEERGSTRRHAERRRTRGRCRKGRTWCWQWSW